MSFMHEVKYRGCVPLTLFVPTHAQPRPGLVEANAALKFLLGQEKTSTLCVLSVSSDMGIKCVDTSFNPPKVVMSNSITEICHCGVDVSRSEYVSCTVGTKMGETTTFFCHVFKCMNKDTANKVARAVASACTIAFQARQGAAGAGGKALSRGAGAAPGDLRQSFQKSVKATSTRHSVRATAVALVPKLTDAWFRPSMSRQDVNAILTTARVGDFIIRESSTQPGDYAIAVQTGGFIWTGLIIQTPQGYQVGKTGTQKWNEITDMVMHFMNNEFVKSQAGATVFLRLPQDTSDGKDRRPTFKNPPVLETAGESGTDSQKFTSAPESFGGGPSCGWPSDDDDDQPSFLSKGKGGAGAEEEDEQAAFDAIMNGTMGVKLEDEGQEGGDGMMSALQEFANDLFATLPTDGEGFVDGREARGILMRSGLDVQTLGAIWQEVDQEQRGKLDLDQFTLTLGLIAQAQQGQSPSIETLDVDTIEPPKLQ